MIEQMKKRDVSEMGYFTDTVKNNVDETCCDNDDSDGRGGSALSIVKF